MGHGCTQHTKLSVAGSAHRLWTMLPFALVQHDAVVTATGEAPSRLRCEHETCQARCLRQYILAALSTVGFIKSASKPLTAIFYAAPAKRPTGGEPNVRPTKGAKM